MRARPAEVPVDDDHRHQDGHRVHDEGEEQVLGDQRQHQRGRRQDFRHEKQEHHERQQNADSESHLLSRLGGEVEHEHTQERDEHRRQDQVHRVEERLPPDRDPEGDVRLLGRRLVLVVEVRGNLDDVPRAGLPVVGEIDELLVVEQLQRHLVAVEGPAAELHHTRLLVEREVRHVDCARALRETRDDGQCWNGSVIAALHYCSVSARPKTVYPSIAYFTPHAHFKLLIKVLTVRQKEATIVTLLHIWSVALH